MLFIIASIDGGISACAFRRHVSDRYSADVVRCGIANMYSVYKFGPG